MPLPVPTADDRAALCLGRPRFADPQFAALAAEHGDAAAWRAAFARDGLDAPAAVSGDFAVGLRDDNGRVFMAIDRFAVRTLCFVIDGNGLRFAQRADALAAAAPDLDVQAIYHYLYFHVIPSPRTIFQGVRRLEPGHAACFDAGQLTLHRYWTPAFDERHDLRFEPLRERFLGLLEDGVRHQIGTHDPARVGCFLSGGTDSSTVAGMFPRVAGLPPRSFSIGFDATGYDEMSYARIAAREFACVHHEYYVTPDDLVRDIPLVAAHYDQPFGNSSALPAFVCASRARADGIDLMLAGDGGDELFGGNSRYAMQRIFGWYDVLPSAARSHLLEPVLRLPASARVRLLRRAAGYVTQAKVPLPDRLQMFNLLSRLGADAVLTPALQGQVDLDTPAREQRAVWAQAGSASPINRLLAFDWRYTLADNDLPKVRETTALAGVEVGFPLLDDALLDFSLTLPSEYKLRRLKLRWFFKEALKGFLPPAIIDKKKHGFGLPFGVWAVSHPALNSLASQSLASLAARGVVRGEFTRTLMSDRLPEAPGYYGEMVWILMMLEQWLQAHAPDWRLID